MKRKKSPGIDQILTEIGRQISRAEVNELNFYLEYKRIATTCNDCFFLPWRNGLW